MGLKTINRRFLRNYQHAQHRHAIHLLIALICTVIVLASQYREYVKPTHSRCLLSSLENCENRPLKTFEKQVELAIFCYTLLTLYGFLGIAIVCDDHFMPSLEKISEKLSLSEDVAGATFLAAAGSAPELFTNAVDTIAYSNNIGIGTIVGSAMFNILIIIAASAIAAPGPLKIDWRPFARDVVFYCLSIGLVLIFFLDGVVWWWESLLFLLLYIIYILYMVKNDAIMKFLCPIKKRTCVEISLNELENRNLQKTMKNFNARRKFRAVVITVMIANRAASHKTLKIKGHYSSDDKLTIHAGSNHVKEIEILEEKMENNDADVDTDADADADAPWYLSLPKHMLVIISWPLVKSFQYTIPPCQEARWGRWYMISFFSSILWIAAFAYMMVTLATWTGCVLNINPVILGVTILAVGTSVPDAIGSILASKEGKGGMACSNAIGSNVFDICIGLGVPWAFRCIFFDSWGYVTVYVSDLRQPVLILFGTVLLVVGIFAYTKFRLTKILGISLCLLYVIYVVYIIVYEST